MYLKYLWRVNEFEEILMILTKLPNKISYYYSCRKIIKMDVAYFITFVVIFLITFLSYFTLSGIFLWKSLTIIFYYWFYCFDAFITHTRMLYTYSSISLLGAAWRVLAYMEFNTLTNKKKIIIEKEFWNYLNDTIWVV